jgi:hypothetical protein
MICHDSSACGSRLYKQRRAKPKSIKQTLNPGTKASASFISGPTCDVLQEDSSCPPRHPADGSPRYGCASKPGSGGVLFHGCTDVLCGAACTGIGNGACDHQSSICCCYPKPFHQHRCQPACLVIIHYRLLMHD